MPRDSRTVNERLADLTPEEIYEAAIPDERIVRSVAGHDPRVKLMEKVYGTPTSKKLLQQATKIVLPDASIPDLDIPTVARAAIDDDVKAVQKLRKELEDEKQQGRHSKFRSQLREHADALGFTPDEKELEKIEQFMVDNEYGVKAADKAVEKYYETQYPVEGNFESDHAFTFADESSDYMKKLLAAPPGADTSQLTMAHAEHVWRDMFGKKGAGRQQVFTA